MKKKIDELREIHKDQDIWIIAAGASMNYVDPTFFDNKITVGVNRVCKNFKCDFVVAKDGCGFKEILETVTHDTKLVLSKHESGNLHQNLNHVDFEHWIFEHPAKPGEQPQLESIKKDGFEIVVSYSTITSAIHFAAFLGAKNIMICGHDCGTLDGESTILGYYDKIRPHQGTEAGYVNWLSNIESHTVAVCDTLQKEYGCNIHSLNPFINLNLEGHAYNPSNKGTKFQRKLKKEQK